MSKKTLVVDAICSQRRQIRVVIALLIVMVLLTLFSLSAVRPGDRTFPLIIINSVLLVLSLGFFIPAYWYCIKREMDDDWNGSD